LLESTGSITKTTAGSSTRPVRRSRICPLRTSVRVSRALFVRARASLEYCAQNSGFLSGLETQTLPSCCAGCEIGLPQIEKEL
jgi:hypothetical protein